jgi:hypothetical protein
VESLDFHLLPSPPVVALCPFLHDPIPDMLNVIGDNEERDALVLGHGLDMVFEPFQVVVSLVVETNDVSGRE